MHTQSHTLHTHSVKQTFRLTHIDEGTQTPSESHPLKHTDTSHTLSDTLILRDDIFSTNVINTHMRLPRRGAPNHEIMIFFSFSRIHAI